MNNPAAFPIVMPSLGDGAVYVNPGMTLRDYFAAKVMQAWVADSFSKDLAIDKEACARFTYKIADAMLAERQKGAQE